MKPSLIAPKHISEFTPEDYHSYVSGMYALRVKRSTKPASPVPGLTLSKLKSGKWSVKRNKKQRGFDWVSMTEIAALAKWKQCSQADLWNAFKARNFIIAKDRLEAERIYGNLMDLPW